MRGLEDDHFTPFFSKGPPPSAKIILALVISLGLMALDKAQTTLDPVRNSLATLLQPMQVAAELPADAWELASSYIDRDDLLSEKRQLERKVLLLEGRLQKLAALEAENERIRNLLASARSLDENILIAEILSVSPDPYRHHVKLNKGTMDGVGEGQALIDGNGIMGQVTGATPMGATAIMITDSNHGIPVEFNRTGLQTIAQGRGKAEQLTLPFLPSNADVRKGDLLVSSGLGGRYPSGYPVAKVSRVSHQAGDEFLTVVAEPTASLNRGREVLLVWSEQPEMPKQTETGTADASDEAGPSPVPADDTTDTTDESDAAAATQ